jgi:acid phosphatase type 7
MLTAAVFAVCAATAGSAIPLAGAPGARAASDPVIIAVGDIACAPQNPDYNGGKGTATACRMGATELVAAAQSPVAALILGDEQYYCGLLADFNVSYNASWGLLNSIAYPVPGNHEYGENAVKGNCTPSEAQGYFTYFGARARTPGKGYYSFNLGAWHLIALNSQCDKVSCAAGSPQETWLKNDLANDTAKCTLAYWHEPLFTSTTGAEQSAVRPFWNDLYNAHADLILNGHAHNYERFKPQTPGGVASANGITEIVVGTGGEDHNPFLTTHANSVVRNNNTFGVLKLTLHATSYTWQFMPIAGQSFTDSGTASCH